jgi:hypothetical protein
MVRLRRGGRVVRHPCGQNKNKGTVVVRERTLIIVLLVVGACSLICGCATTKKIADDIMGPDRARALKKKIVFMPTVNRSGFGGKDLKTAASLKLKIALTAQCGQLVISDSRKMRQVFAEIPRLPSGQIDNLALAEKGRLYGVNAVLEQTISLVEFDTEKRGIWGFREEAPLLHAVFRIRIYDVETTATSLDEVFREELELSDGPWEEDGGSASHYYDEYADTLLGRIIPKISALVCERMEEMLWSGFVVESNDGTYTLSSGSDVGIAEGDVLEVFKMGEPIQGLGDQVYLIEGPKMGEMEVTQIKADKAKAIPISGSDFERSCCVKLKP